jgi:hypothetical protein
MPTLLFVYAKTVVECLPVVVKENYYGCEVDHPSQTQHACLMWTISEHLDTYYEETFNQIKYELMRADRTNGYLYGIQTI